MYYIILNIAKLLEEYMLVANIIIKSNIDIVIKKIVEKLYFKSKDLIRKESLDQCYLEEINALKRKLGHQIETTNSNC